MRVHRARCAQANFVDARHKVRMYVSPPRVSLAWAYGKSARTPAARNGKITSATRSGKKPYRPSRKYGLANRSGKRLAKTLLPSNGGMGIMLKNAKTKFVAVETAIASL